MRRFIVFVLIITLSTLMVACNTTISDAPGNGTAQTPPASPSPHSTPEATKSAPPKATPAPRVYKPEELLSAKDVEDFVGQPVQASFDSTSGDYIYDIPIEGIDVTDSFATIFYLTQNGLISPSELKKGHDAKWAFEDFRKSNSDKAVDFPGLGGKAFYMNNNSDVHVLFQDYYFMVAFRIDSTDFDKNLALNKSIASFIVNEISVH